jgi:hypothetical protein
MKTEKEIQKEQEKTNFHYLLKGISDVNITVWQDETEKKYLRGILLISLNVSHDCTSYLPLISKKYKYHDTSIYVNKIEAKNKVSLYFEILNDLRVYCKENKITNYL